MSKNNYMQKHLLIAHLSAPFFLPVAFHKIDAAIISNTIKLIIQQCVFDVHGSKVFVLGTSYN